MDAFVWRKVNTSGTNLPDDDVCLYCYFKAIAPTTWKLQAGKQSGGNIKKVLESSNIQTIDTIN